MLALTRELASQLNQRARSHRLAAEPETGALSTAGRVATLADGNQASAGDRVITRSNDRRLPPQSTTG